MAIFEQATKKEKSLSDYCADCFMLILQLRSIVDYGDAGLLRQRVLELLDEFERKSLSSGIQHNKIQAAKFALTAFIDETIIGSDWENKTEWLAEPLQLKLFSCFNAGEEFFVRLNQLKERIRENIDVLEVYFLCLSLGYKGKYLMEAPEQVRSIIDDLNQDLNQYLGKPVEILSPNGRPHDEIVNVVKEKVPLWVIIVAAFALGLFFYLIMSVLISGEADSVLQTLQNRL